MAQKTLAQLESAKNAAEKKFDAAETKWSDADTAYYREVNAGDKKKAKVLLKKKDALGKLLTKARKAFNDAETAIKTHPDYVAPSRQSYC